MTIVLQAFVFDATISTLMQNNHKELWNLVDLVQTNYFGTKDEFNSFVANPIAMGR